MKIGILGAGLTGLTIANHLKKDFEILEKNECVGGLCRSFSEKRYTWDIGGHILYSRDKKLLNEMLSFLGKNKVKGVRNNKIFFKGRFVKYPFENGLSELPEEDNKECLDKFLNNPMSKIKPTNFTQWMYKMFGDGITEKYLLPYNEKIWNFPPHQMSCHWVEGRVPKPPKIDIINSSKGIKTEGYKEQINFIYPKKGGIAALISAMHKKVKKKIVKFEARLIRKVNKRWLIINKSKTRVYDKIISTIPLSELISMLQEVPLNVRIAADSLKYNSLALVALGYKMDPKNKKDFTAIYFPQKEFLFNRLCFMENFSPQNVPFKNRSLITAEITYKKGSAVDKYFNDINLKNKIIRDLDKLGIADKNDLDFCSVKRFNHAYIIYDKDYQYNIKVIKDYLRKKGIYICGRFGQWEYWNMDKVYEEAKKLAQRLNRKV